MLIFHQSHLLPVITLPINQTPPNCKSFTILRKTLHEKLLFSKQTSQKSLQGQRKCLQREDLPFEEGFKRKYHSVFSQMIKIKHLWQQQQENRPPPLSISKFYSRMSTSILKINSHDHKSKLKLKYNTRQSLQARQSLKLNAQSSKNQNGNFKLYSLYEKEDRLQKELTVPLKKSKITFKKKAMSNFQVEQGGCDGLDLGGWNNLEQIRQDDLY